VCHVVDSQEPSFSQWCQLRQSRDFRFNKDRIQQHIQQQARNGEEAEENGDDEGRALAQDLDNHTNSYIRPTNRSLGREEAEEEEDETQEEEECEGADNEEEEDEEDTEPEEEEEEGEEIAGRQKKRSRVVQ
jgi:hypothetical protein